VSSISVVVPTFRRPSDLQRCLEGLAKQSCTPVRIVVVAQADDCQTLAVLAKTNLRYTLITVSEPGQVQALAAGLGSVDTDIVAFTDDDAVPRPDWTSRILEHFANPLVGGVGGRDIIAGDESQPLCTCVGLVGPWGRVIGNHHVGTGGPREVDVLKGVNMAFRRHLVQFPSGLRGEGSQIHNDLALSLWVRSLGWRLIYDPLLIVDHYPGVRPSGSPRFDPPAKAIADGAYNQAAAIMASRTVPLARLVTYGLIVGDRAYPGPGRCLVGIARGEGQQMLRHVIPSLHGRLAAYYAYLRGYRLGYDMPRTP
jgi:glycosyltransferase involved in cell wall biosynthesis